MIEEQYRWEKYAVLLGEKPQRWALVDGMNFTVAIIREVGGSWECLYNDDVIAVRPDLESAKRAVEALVCGAETE